MTARQAGSKVRPARAPPFLGSRTRIPRFLNAKPPTRRRPEPCLIFPKRKGRIVLRTCASRHGAGAERTVGRESRTARRKKARHKDHTKRAQVIEPICAAPPPRLVPVPGLLVLAKETVHVPSPNTDVMCMPSSPLVSCQRVGSAWRYGWMVHHETARHGTRNPGYPTNYSADSVISRVRNERHRGEHSGNQLLTTRGILPSSAVELAAPPPRATCCACMQSGQTLLAALLLQGFWLMYRAVYSCLLFWGRPYGFARRSCCSLGAKWRCCSWPLAGRTFVGLQTRLSMHFG